METVLLWLLGQGSFVSFVVSLLKRIPFVTKYPKVCSAILNVLMTLVAGSIVALPSSVTGFILAVAAALGWSVVTYEAGTKSIGKAMQSVGN